MKMTVVAVAVIGALATGGVPTAVLTFTGSEQGTETATADDPPAAKDNPDAAKDQAVRPEGKPAVEKSGKKLADGKPGWGPAAHAQSRHNVAKPNAGRADGPAKPKAGTADKGARHGQKMSALGRAHGKAMRAWGACVSAQPNKDAEGFDPEAACGVKPTPPGHLKRGTGAKQP